MGSSLKFSFKLKVNERTRVGPKSVEGGTSSFELLSSLCICAKYIFFGSEGLSSLRLRNGQLPICVLSLALLSEDVRSSLPYQAIVGDLSLHSRSLWTPLIFSTSGILPYVNQGKALGYKSLSRDLLSAQVGESAAAGAILPLVLVTPVVGENNPNGWLEQ